MNLENTIGRVLLSLLVSGILMLLMGTFISYIWG
jgi:hypothetical protein